MAGQLKNLGAAAETDAIREQHVTEADAVREQQFCTERPGAQAKLLVCGTHTCMNRFLLVLTKEVDCAPSQSD